ncbi:MAG TPA: hypothetical protein VKD69_21985 [Vicinamibacterales bacterium]|nr:hypothetical protein [Vicinamibacterales bacterium]
MKTLIKLALVAIVANAAWHVFVIYSAYWKFTDAVQYAAEYRGKKSNDEIKQEVLGIAAQADLPIDEDSLTVSLAETHTTIDTGYVRNVELFPGFTYAWPFTVHVDTYTKPSIDAK